jgi:hypothetical protein
VDGTQNVQEQAEMMRNQKEECCGTCLHHVHEGGKYYICENESSENYMYETMYDDSCEDYENKYEDNYE